MTRKTVETDSPQTIWMSKTNGNIFIHRAICTSSVGIWNRSGPFYIEYDDNEVEFIGEL